MIDLLTFVGALAIAGALVWGALRISQAVRISAPDESKDRALQILTTFAPGIDAVARDPSALLTWEPLARAVRHLFPEACARLDTAAGGTFPFNRERIQAAHARWTAEWLAWERMHDAQYKLKTAAIEAEQIQADGSPLLRARLDAVEREKLDLYQRRYEEYIRVAKALQALLG